MSVSTGEKVIRIIPRPSEKYSNVIGSRCENAKTIFSADMRRYTNPDTCVLGTMRATSSVGKTLRLGVILAFKEHRTPGAADWFEMIEYSRLLEVRI